MHLIEKHGGRLVFGATYAQFSVVGWLMSRDSVGHVSTWAAGSSAAVGLSLLLLRFYLDRIPRSELNDYIVFVLGVLGITITAGSGLLLIASQCILFGMLVLGIGLRAVLWAVHDR